MNLTVVVWLLGSACGYYSFRWLIRSVYDDWNWCDVSLNVVVSLLVSWLWCGVSLFWVGGIKLTNWGLKQKDSDSKPPKWL